MVSLPYIPDPFKVKDKRLQYKYKGIATAVPEVAELDAFCDIFPRLLDDLGSDETLANYPPRNMVIHCPEQAGLDMLSRVCALTAAKGGRGKGGRKERGGGGGEGGGGGRGGGRGGEGGEGKEGRKRGGEMGGEIEGGGESCRNRDRQLRLWDRSMVD